jgi:tryptophan synthase
LLALEAGGTDVIELGIPFSDPIADGPVIQRANTVSFNYAAASIRADMPESYRERRSLCRLPGVHSPGKSSGLEGTSLADGYVCSIIDADGSGYYNPLLAYGEEKAVQDLASAGGNGYIMVDLPPAEARHFRNICVKNG